MRCYFATPLTCIPTFYSPYNVLCINSSKSCTPSNKSVVALSKPGTPCLSNRSRSSCWSRSCIPCCVPCDPCESICPPSTLKEKLFNLNDGVPAGSSNVQKKNKKGTRSSKGNPKKDSKQKGILKVVKVLKADKENETKKEKVEGPKSEREKVKNKKGKVKETDENVKKADENVKSSEDNIDKTEGKVKKTDDNVRNLGTNENENQKSEKETPTKVDRSQIAKGVLSTNDADFEDPKKNPDLGKTGGNMNDKLDSAGNEGTFSTCTPRFICRCPNQRRPFSYSDPYQTCTPKVHFNTNVPTSYSQQNNASAVFDNRFGNRNICRSCEEKLSRSSRMRQFCSLCGRCNMQYSTVNASRNNFRPCTSMGVPFSSYHNHRISGVDGHSRPSVHHETFSRPDSAISGRSYRKCGTCGSVRMLGDPTLSNIPMYDPVKNRPHGSVYGEKRIGQMSSLSFRCQVNPQQKSSLKMNVSQKMNLIYPSDSKKISCFRLSSRVLKENSRVCFKSRTDIVNQTLTKPYHLSEFWIRK